MSRASTHPNRVEIDRIVADEAFTRRALALAWHDSLAVGARWLKQRDEAEAAAARQADRIAMLARRGVVTTDPADRDGCCGLPRDVDGFCVHRPGHPIYVGAP